MRAELLLLFAFIVTFNRADPPVTSPVVCGEPNEEFAIDLKRCQNTCEFYGRTWNCPANYYKPKGDCYCKDGFARITEGGKCVSVKKNKKCKAQLPITADSCTGPNESFVEAVRMGTCDTNCLTFRCSSEYTPAYEYVWGPHCECKNSLFRRLSNGTCVNIFHEECEAEYQPSQERCTAVGLLYKKNAPCQPACDGKTYCPPSAGACVCPPNKLAFLDESVIRNEVSQQLIWLPKSLNVVSCYRREAYCPVTPAPAPSGGSEEPQE